MLKKNDNKVVIFLQIRSFASQNFREIVVGYEKRVSLHIR